MNIHDENRKLAEQVQQFKTMLADAKSISDIVTALNKMQPIVSIDGFIDKASSHEYADEFLLKALRLSGNTAVADAYESLKKRMDGFWYS